jgi:MFS family permease
VLKPKADILHMYKKFHFAFLNIGHFLDHFFMLVFATVAALALNREWGLSYSQLIPYATPGFVAFAVFTFPSGWLADKWSRKNMLAVFFVGMGVSSILASLATSPVEIAVALFLVGMFAAIYHPVGLPLVIAGREKTGMPIALNGIYGNLGVGSAALITGMFIDYNGWRAAFIWPGMFSILAGIIYYWMFCRASVAEKSATVAVANKLKKAPVTLEKSVFLRVLVLVFMTTALGGLIFQSTTFSLPKVFDERLGSIASSATMIGWYAFIVFSLAALAQVVVGYLLDRYSLRYVFMGVSLGQAIFFAAMPGLNDMAAVIVACAFMLVVFGQIPINDVLLGRITKDEWRSRVFAARYVVTFTVLAVTVPFIAWIHANWGFDTLFTILATAAAGIFTATLALPHLRPQEVGAQASSAAE